MSQVSDPWIKWLVLKLHLTLEPEEALSHEQVVTKLNSLLNDSKQTPAKEEVTTLKSVLDRLSKGTHKYTEAISSIISSADIPVKVVGSIESTGDTKIHGQFNSTTGEVLLTKDASIETAIHEGVHAATFNKILDYYSGAKTSVTVKAAITRIEKLLVTAEARLDTLSESERESVQNMLDTLAQYSEDTPQDKASD